jgi:tricorn protease
MRDRNFAVLCRSLVALTACVFFLAFSRAGDDRAPRPGYYRYPAIYGDTVIFTAEGDLWTVSASGGAARRLTSNPGRERYATISPDGKTVAFSAEYEGPLDVYTMPVDGGLPQRRTWDGDARPVGWNPDGRLLVSTERYSTLPDAKLVALSASGAYQILPLAQASQGVYAPDGRTLYFTRLARQPSFTKRYQGGTAQSIWRYDGGSEAVDLTGDWTGTSNTPMFWNGRLYFLSDRDGVMNIYSINPNGTELKQQTHQHTFDVQSASLSQGRIAYGCGADIWLLDLTTGQEGIVPITLVSDFDQLREHWVNAPLKYLTAAHIAPDGTAAVFTTRGEVFSAPAVPGRIVRVAANSAVRFRDARFLPNGKSILVLSTESGETEFWKYPANGVGAAKQWTSDSKVLGLDGFSSPDGRWLAHYDKDHRFWLFDTQTKQERLIAQSEVASIPALRAATGDFADLAWSPDSRWLAYVDSAANTFRQIQILNVASGAIQALTSDRYNSLSPVWSTDGKWLYFLSDRNMKTIGYSPFRTRQPDPSFDRFMKIYEVALVPGLRSPFLPADELHPDQNALPEEVELSRTKESDEVDKKDAPNREPHAHSTDVEKPTSAAVSIDFADAANRLTEIPVPAGNYSELQGAESRLCWISSDSGPGKRQDLQCLNIAATANPPDTVVADVKDYEVSLDRKKMLVQKGDDFFILSSDAKAGFLSDSKAFAKAKIDLSGWSFSINPRSEFRQLFIDAWRLERDYFYARDMHGLDWSQIRDRYLPLVDRVSDRDELNDVIAQMCGELSALHIFVGGGDSRRPADHVDLASLGAVLWRDEKAGGFVVAHIYAHDPDLPNEAPPLARPESIVREGEVITNIDGEEALGAPDERVLLRGKVGQRVLLTVKSSTAQIRGVLVSPIPEDEEADLRYKEWEYTRRKKVETNSRGQIGYIHLRAMGSQDIEQWEREFYPVYDRAGLIIDVRHNNGGNIDSWLLEKLLRRAWSYWQLRVGEPFWNMPYAFRGHIALLCDQYTLSDGEVFAEGFKRLALGKVVGMRTWGGGVWMHANNRLSDGGIATAAEVGVYGPEGRWLIEGHGVDPDIVVDNLPHTTFAGGDAQLDEALHILMEAIKEDPRPVPKPPPYPNKISNYQK